jgi:uncharacterized coiled-coil protein SlyX
MNATSSTHTDLTYEQVEDMWRHPHELTPMEYELVKYILNKELYDDDGNSIEDLEQRIDDYEYDLREKERELAHMAAIIVEQDYKLDQPNDDLFCIKKELAAYKEENNGQHHD